MNFVKYAVTIHIDVMLETISFLFEDFDNFDYFKHLIMVY